jgi:signal transduction histidine kinase/CheY-like chemotaxis protein
MLSALSEWLFGGSGLAPHGYCLLWEPGLVWLYAISDLLIGISYFSIPLTLVVLVKRRSDLVFRPLVWLFAAFILFCGTTHLLDVVTLWTPVYGVLGLVKAATAIASVATAVALWWALPKFLAIPSVAQLQQANAALLETESRLAQSQKIEAIGRLTGGIAHDFNNLLQVIVGSLGVIEHQLAMGRGDKIGPALGAIRKASHTASRLISQMLAFSLRQTLVARVIDLNKLVSGMEEMLRRTLGPGIRLDLSLNSGWNVTCDPSQLESALLNLAINARDAMPEGGLLRIETADRALSAERPDRELKPGHYVELKVSDNGVGMSPEQLSHVFEPFFTTKPTGKGTGLGLPQVYGFVKQSGGTVQVESSLGQGATVRIYLPACESSANPVEGESQLAEPTVPHSAPHQGTALIVEDQPEVRSQIAQTIEQMGFTILLADDGPSGLKAVQSCKQLDLLITDVGLPGVSGRQVAEAARTAQPSLPILLVTGYAGNALEAFNVTESIAVLRKPFTLDELTSTVRNLLKAAPSPQPSEKLI